MASSEKSIRFLYGLPAAIAGNNLIISDLHIGIEDRLFPKGVRIGNVSENMLKSIEEIIRANRGIKRIIITGDAKESIGQPDKTVIEFFSRLASLAKVLVVKGNHDGGIESIAGINVADATGIVIRAGGKKIGLVHGHAQPKDDIFDCDVIFCGHQHPIIEKTNKFGGIERFRAWIRIPIDLQTAKKKYPRANKNCVLYIIPPFNPALGGRALNRQNAKMITGKSERDLQPLGKNTNMIGPVFKNGMFKLSEAEIIMLEGVGIGALFEVSRGDKVIITKNR